MYSMFKIFNQVHANVCLVFEITFMWASMGKCVCFHPQAINN